MSSRQVLRPGTTKQTVASFAQLVRWPLVEEVQRDQERGIDGLAEWELPHDVSFFLCEDADFGIPYFVFTGPERRVVAPYMAQAQAALNPWGLDELLERHNRLPDSPELAETTLLVGLAAPNDFNPQVYQRIRSAMHSKNENVRWIAVWSTTYTGYDEFISDLRHTKDNDAVDWVRERASNVLEVFEDLRGT